MSYSIDLEYFYDFSVVFLEMSRQCDSCLFISLQFQFPKDINKIQMHTHHQNFKTTYIPICSVYR